MSQNDYLLEIKDLSLSFSGLPILKNVNLTLKKGEIHALVGENGAGKSSLFRSIMGIISPDSGEIIFLGQSVSHLSVRSVLTAGISMIHQELMLIPELSVAENIFLGRENDQGRYLSVADIHHKVNTLFKEFELEIDPKILLKDLSIAGQQLVEIMRSVSQQSTLILMDEPTSSLTEKEVLFFTKLILKLRASGIGILFTSHKMDEVFGFSDVVSVLRDGEMVGTFELDQVNPHTLVQKMVGREMNDFYPKSDVKLGQSIFSVHELSYQDVFSGINFDLKAGEVLGLAGLVGAGRTDIGQVIFGIKRKSSGTMYFKNEVYNPACPTDALHVGMGYLGEDRKEMGIIPEMDVRENLTLGLLGQFQRFYWIRSVLEATMAKAKIKVLNIRTKDENQKMNTLSGGSQQKVLLGRILLNNPAMLILDEPTRGIDVMSKFEIYQLMIDLKKQGKAIVLISSDLSELLEMSDRVLVVSKGKQQVILSKAEATPETVLEYALHESYR